MEPIIVRFCFVFCFFEFGLKTRGGLSWLVLNAVAAIGCALFALQQFAGINGVLYFSSLTFRDAGITNGTAASAAVGGANLVGTYFVYKKWMKQKVQPTDSHLAQKRYKM